MPNVRELTSAADVALARLRDSDESGLPSYLAAREALLASLGPCAPGEQAELTRALLEMDRTVLDAIAIVRRQIRDELQDVTAVRRALHAYQGPPISTQSIERLG